MVTLRQLRLSKGLSLRGVGGNWNHLSLVEKGQREPGPELIRRLAQVYACSTEEVFAAWQESCRVATAEAKP